MAEKKYCIFNGELCELMRIVNSNACIVTDKGIRFVHISKIDIIEPEEEKAEDFEDMTKAELIDYAEKNNIEVDPKSKKADIIEAIVNA